MSYFYGTNVRREQFLNAERKYPNNKWAIHNHLKKNYDYTDNEAWDVAKEFGPVKYWHEVDAEAARTGEGQGRVAGNGQTLGEILADALKSRPEYIITDLHGAIAYQGDEARRFVEMADKVNIPRTAYRVFQEVKA